jgi:hypothetical protein
MINDAFLAVNNANSSKKGEMRRWLIKCISFDDEFLIRKA